VPSVEIRDSRPIWWLAAQVASGLDSTESTIAFPSDCTTDHIFADSTYQRWRMNE
jgi:hypothetical protein